MSMVAIDLFNIGMQQNHAHMPYIFTAVNQPPVPFCQEWKMLFVFVPRTHSNLHMFCRGNKICRDAVHDLELTFPSQPWTTITRTSPFFNYNPFSNAHSHNLRSSRKLASVGGHPLQPYHIVDVRLLTLVWSGWVTDYAPSSSSPTRMAPSFAIPWAQKPSRETELHRC
jgi:hypothetical protein